MCRLLLLVAAALTATAKTITYDFEIGWVSANPDGQFERQVIGINGQWPIPTIRGDVGDRIIINTLNSLGDQDTSLHFHGLFMNGTTHMDGPVQVSQCPIPPGARFTYNFTLQQPGTYWYHSHNKGQYPDGLRGPLIINDPENPHKDLYSEELVLSVSDWYHDPMTDLIAGFMYKGNPTGAEPVPDAALWNETQDLKVAVRPNTTYLFRVVNIGAFAGQYIWAEGHTMQIVEVDGVYTQPADAEMIYLSAAQRCSFLITTKNDTSANFPLVASMDTSLFDTLPDTLNWNVTAWLTYNDTADFPGPALVDELSPFDDITLVPYDQMELLPEPDQTFELNVIMDDLSDGANYAFFNNITYKHPTVPTLYTALTSGANATSPEIYGTYTHAMVLEKDSIVQIVVNNLDSGRHPFHLHGHNFQALYRSDEEGGTWEDTVAAASVDFPKTPMRRDTFVLYPDGNIVLRFKADNAGIWLFHCHIEWHVVSGLMATFVEAPLELQKTISIPQDHYAACSADNIPVKGNAAGNVVDLFNLNGQPSPPPPLPEGFTTRGIVALVFSTLCGILGVLVVIWYGLADEPAVPTAELAGAAAGNGNDLVVRGPSSSDDAVAGEEKSAGATVQGRVDSVSGSGGDGGVERESAASGGR
ncbi:ferroxidase [Microdochium trichocladiopsis]|uniref:Ferroxidase n=1 Tax=Microdochium trichocladiopsis TaxID=1682393 RepID=A0A9P8XZW5_9PEZI|nr:ferroxidase [Microdochium trichocladiopsis]KAH7025110.1 ferroxidase [Microdochium trichocladiopsis]